MSRTACLVLLGLLFAVVSTSRAQDHQMPPSITVTGQAETSATPDVAQVTVGVTTEAASPSEALAMNTDAMTQLMETLKNSGIEKKSIQTAHFNVSPKYVNEPNRDPKIVGYQVTNQVRADVKDIAKLGEVLEAVVTSGANRIDGINFRLSRRRDVLDAARAEALADARRAAQTYAAAAGVELGRLLSVREQGAEPPMPYGGVGFAMARAAVPVAAGEVTVTANLSATYEIVYPNKKP
ncbi:MAG: SIMPL domain-containing protein [Pirellulales bacterium]|nr:SIMPL domain-containing protein [Pirellulales bacterium]